MGSTAADTNLSSRNSTSAQRSLDRGAPARGDPQLALRSYSYGTVACSSSDYSSEYSTVPYRTLAPAQVLYGTLPLLLASTVEGGCRWVPLRAEPGVGHNRCLQEGEGAGGATAGTTPAAGHPHGLPGPAPLGSQSGQSSAKSKPRIQVSAFRLRGRRDCPS